jgi:hypothetical protein
MVKMTPCTPCCEGCVIEAFERAGASVHEAFVIVSGLEELGDKARARYVESVIGSMGTKVFLMIETPAPAKNEPGDEIESGDDADEAVDEDVEKTEAN